MRTARSAREASWRPNSSSDSVWNEVFPAEQERILQLVVKRIDICRHNLKRMAATIMSIGLREWAHGF